MKYDSETADLLTDLTNEFYTLIPTSEYRTSSIPPINRMGQVNDKIKELNELLYSEIVIRIICGAQLRIKEIHPVDYCFSTLSFKILPVSKQELEYKLIK